MLAPSLKACEPTKTELGLRTLPERPELLRGKTQHDSLSVGYHVYGEKKNPTSIQCQGSELAA